MFEEIAKRIHEVAEAWQYACEAGDVVQDNFHRGELSQLVSTMQSAQQTRVPDGALVVRDSSGVVTCSVCGTGLGVE